MRACNMKKILYGVKARKQIQKGVNICADVAKVSLGHNGRNVLIYNGQVTDIINDGVSIVNEVEEKDETLQAGILLAKQCARRTNAVAGDGTTTTLVLLQSLLNYLLSDTRLEKPRKLRADIWEDTYKTIENLEKNSRVLKGKKDIENIATTASLDPKIGAMIADIFDELGRDADVTIEETQYDVLEKETVEGVQFDTRRAARYLDKKQSYEDLHFLILDNKASVSNIKDKITTLSGQGIKQLLVVAPQWGKDAIAYAEALKLEGVFEIVAVKNEELNEEDLKVLGNQAKKVIVTEENTTIIGGNGDVKNRVKEIKGLLDKEESEFEKEKLRKRIAYLTGGVALIRVGKPTDVERQETVLKVEDAINSAKYAHQGIVKGGGLALMEASVGSLKDICEAPRKQIKENSENDAPVNDFIIDSLHVVKTSLTNAVSTATSILTAEAAIIEINED